MLPKSKGQVAEEYLDAYHERVNLGVVVSQPEHDAATKAAEYLRDWFADREGVFDER